MMFDRIRTAWSLAKSSWQVLQHDRELAWLPVLATVVGLAAGALFGTVVAMAAFAAVAVWAVVVFATVSALEGIFQTALYRQVTGRSIPAAIDARPLSSVVRRRRARDAGNARSARGRRTLTDKASRPTLSPISPDPARR